MKDKKPSYWKKCGNHQKVKHAVLRRYLQGWLPKLGFAHGRILYVDTHAGRGQYESGESGSPMVALDALVEHRECDRILEGCKVTYFFMEANQGNADMLDGLLQERELPSKVDVNVLAGDSYEHLVEMLECLESEGKSMAPTFALVDPYSYQLPGESLRKLMAFPRVELFINVIWREHDMARISAESQPGGKFEEQMNAIFPGKTGARASTTTHRLRSA